MDSPSKQVRSRRTHRKSRLGCMNCKKRRIKRLDGQNDNDGGANENFKCDEKRPTCLNCINHDVKCSFASHDSAPSPQTDISEPSEPQAQPRRYKPYQYPTGELQQTFKVQKINQRKSQPSTETETQPDIPTDASTGSIITPEDLKLFHNFTISTYRTMRDDEEDRNNLWQKHIPEWGIEFKPIMHLILALSALHMGYETPPLRERYIAQADAHFTFGMRTVTSVLSQLNAENCQQIYMSAVLICFIYFARGPRPGEFLVFSDTGPAEWLVLMNGVKLVVSTHHERIYSGLLQPDGEKKIYTLTPTMRSEQHEHSVHLQAVQRLVEEQIPDESARDIYISAIDNLFVIMDEIYERVSGGKEGVMLMDALIGWLYRRQDEFVRALERKDPLALVILSYWGVLFRYMESAWFMEGWACHVLGGIERSLERDYWAWIEWPLRKVGRP